MTTIVDVMPGSVMASSCRKRPAPSIVAAS